MQSDAVLGVMVLAQFLAELSSFCLFLFLLLCFAWLDLMENLSAQNAILNRPNEDREQSMLTLKTKLTLACS